jgi:CO/xanthine dehydrogenase Mo-binding subunit
VINPKIVRGMTMGGIAHGIGAALYEEFAYNGDGLLVAQSFMDYLLPSAHEVPPVEIVHHETPSPHTVFGQKGSGESGYLGAPGRGRERGERRGAAARHRGQLASYQSGAAWRYDRGST